MRLNNTLFFWIQFFYCFTYADTINTNLEKGLLGLIYNCNTLNNCNDILEENIDTKEPIASFFQDSDSSISYNNIASEFHKLDIENSNFIVQKSGYFKRMLFLLTHFLLKETLILTFNFFYSFRKWSLWF